MAHEIIIKITVKSARQTRENQSFENFNENREISPGRQNFLLKSPVQKIVKSNLEDDQKHIFYPLKNTHYHQESPLAEIILRDNYYKEGAKLTQRYATAADPRASLTPARHSALA